MLASAVASALRALPKVIFRLCLRVRVLEFNQPGHVRLCDHAEAVRAMAGAVVHRLRCRQRANARHFHAIAGQQFQGAFALRHAERKRGKERERAVDANPDISHAGNDRKAAGWEPGLRQLCQEV
jgi:hypothetical protein